MNILHAWARFNGRLICRWRSHDFPDDWGSCQRCASPQYYILIPSQRAIRPLISYKGGTVTYGPPGIVVQDAPLEFTRVDHYVTPVDAYDTR